MRACTWNSRTLNGWKLSFKEHGIRSCYKPVLERKRDSCHIGRLVVTCEVGRRTRGCRPMSCRTEAVGFSPPSFALSDSHCVAR